MNEQIKKIMDDCGFYIPENNYEVVMKEVEFLCETIVKKCADICMQQSYECVDGRASYATGRCSDLIKDHFGVK